MAFPRTPIENILVVGSTYQSNKLRKRLIAEGFLEYMCSCCYGRTWMGRAIPLELDHINGVNDDHRLENLRLLCPNCHAQTENYRGKNHGKASKKHHYSKDTI